MKLLIDTHTALWLFNEHENLPAAVREHLLDETNDLYISIASAWEIAIKRSLGKLPGFRGGVRRFLAAVRQHPIELITVLPRAVGISVEIPLWRDICEFAPHYVETVERLPYVHRDPFDRILIATAMCEDMTIVTADVGIRKYPVKCIW